MKGKQKRKTKTASTKKPKEDRTNPEKTRPDINRIFPTSFGSEPPQNEAKTLAKTHQKHKTNTTTQKQKFAPENFSKSDPKKRGTTKGRQKTPDQTPKKQKEKNGQHWEQERGKKLCDSTVAVCALPPPPSWAVLYSILQERGGGGETESVCQW